MTDNYNISNIIKPLYAGVASNSNHRSSSVKSKLFRTSIEDGARLNSHDEIFQYEELEGMDVDSSSEYPTLPSSHFRNPTLIDDIVSSISGGTQSQTNKDEEQSSIITESNKNSSISVKKNLNLPSTIKSKYAHTTLDHLEDDEEETEITIGKIR